MGSNYSLEIIKKLRQKFDEKKLYRPMRTRYYEAGTKLTYDVKVLETQDFAKVSLTIEKFVGGGFAGQVYKVRVDKISGDVNDCIKVGNSYAMKVLVPPSGFSLLFRNFVYAVGFQAPFQLQCNPAAAMAGALWQKFIRRAAALRFGSEKSVVDIYGVLADFNIGSFGEISEWIEGRTWRLEVDDHMDLLKNAKRLTPEAAEKLGSPEYRAKKEFMAEFVEMLHELGAPEFARQYEWSTCKSQPNCLKRTDSSDEAEAHLVAVDFRAGLALLPFLPMSPGDFKLILKGLARGSLVQFDRGSTRKLRGFVDQHSEHFSDMMPLLNELEKCEDTYRNSIPDITHNHFRLLYSPKLWRTMLDSAVTGWKVRGQIDSNHELSLRRNKVAVFLLSIIGIIPFLGRGIRKLFCHAGWRKHYKSFLLDSEYLNRACYAKMAETVTDWYRAGRLDEREALRASDKVFFFLMNLPLSILPVWLHRFFTDSKYAVQTLRYIFVRPVKLYFDADAREQWLRDMVAEGQSKRMLSDQDAETILSQVKEPFIQKYLKSLAVHVCTLPVTQVVSVAVAAIYYFTHPENPNAWKIGVGIIAAFQVTPISPGSICRGLYVLYLVIRERNFKDYNIAVFLGFFKYVGYLAFPIQMTYRYPALARFMAGHWATEAVHIVPVFGEGGALLEHWVYCLFYNWPLTIRRRMAKRIEIRKTMASSYWHVPICSAVAAGLFALADYVCLERTGHVASLKSDLWLLAIIIPSFCGAVVTLACKGAALHKRFISAVIAGILTAGFYTAASAAINASAGMENSYLITASIWRVFVFAILTTIGAIIAELRLADPELKTMLK